MKTKHQMGFDITVLYRRFFTALPQPRMPPPETSAVVSFLAVTAHRHA